MRTTPAQPEGSLTGAGPTLPARTVSGALAAWFAQAGVRQSFGLIGEDTAAVATAMREVGIAYLPARHEGAAVAMADGYAWASGKLGVAVISRGPGLTNGATAARTAVCGGRQVLIVCGAAPTVGGLVPDPKHVDQATAAAACGLAYFEAVEPDQCGETIIRAFESARAGRPSVLAVAADVLNGPAGPPPPSPAMPAVTRIDPPSDSDVHAALQLLRTAARPLILAGRGALEAGAKRTLEALAETVGAVLGTTMLAREMFRGHRYDIGVVGGFSTDAARAVLAQVDCVLAFGAGLNSFTTLNGRLCARAACMQVDSDRRRIGALTPVELGIAADARVFAELLLAAAQEVAPWKKPLHDPRVLAPLSEPAYNGPDESTESLLDPRVVAVALNDALPGDRTIVLDGGGNMGFAGRFIRTAEPMRFRLSTDFGSIGLGLGVAIGVATARPTGHTVLWMGDGGLVMALGELETLARCSVPLTVIVMNDAAFGAERFVLEDAGLANDLAHYGDVDLAAVARALGIEAERITSVSALRERAGTVGTRGGPLLLDCKIRPDIRGLELW